MLDSDINIASYVINLDRAKDRLVHVRQQFDRIDVGFTRVSAIDAREFSSEQVAYFRDLYCSENGFQSEWSLGYIALFLSHRKTWEMIAKGETAWAAVFEDDVHLSSSLPLFLKSSGLFPNVADIIRIETTLQSMRLSPRPVAQMHGTRLFRVHDGAWGSAGYIIHKDIAQWLSVAPPRFHNSLDWMLFHKSCAVGRALTVFQVDPAPCVQDQYHPDKNARKYFSMETSSKKNRFVNFAREAFGPAARLLRRRRRVSFK
jgi:glycosyl transferase family 25